MTEYFQYIVNGLVVGGVYAIVAVGFVTIYNVSKVINLAQGEFLMLGSMLTVTFIGMHVPYGAAVLLAVLLVMGIGILMQKYIVGMARNATPLSLIILTIGVSIFIRGAASQIWGKDSYTLKPLAGSEPISFAGVSVARQSVWVVLSVAVILIGLWYLMEKTMTGKKIKACSVNPLAARLMGVSPSKMAMLAFAISAATGALAGIVIAPLNVTSYDVGILLGIKGFSAAIFGGLGSPIGATVAGLLLGLLESLGAGLIDSGVKDAIAFLILIGVLLIKPTGLFGERTVGKGGL